MNCQTVFDLGDGRPSVCGHSITRHEGDESGMGAAQPCMMPDCPCKDYTARRVIPLEKCPTCTSPRKAGVHQPVQYEGEISICSDPWHYEGLMRCPVCQSRIRQPAPSHCDHTWHSPEAVRAEISKLREDGEDTSDEYHEDDAAERRVQRLRNKLYEEKCDGNHEMPECSDPQCWHRDPPEPGAQEDEVTKHARVWQENPRKVIQKWADSAMFTAEPLDADAGPRVYLLSMTPDPLAAIAAACKMYKGEVARSYRDVTHKERQEFIAQVLRTKLQAPFEFVKFHFLIEGVTRAFTHQMVRQRTAVYAQESLRFAVKEDMPVGLPPSLAGTTETKPGHHAHREDGAQRMRTKWDRALRGVQRVYDDLINDGMPAEDARGLLPHNTLTRLHYSTDLRALLDHAGNRLCTQAQFEWRLVFSRIAEAIRNYNPYLGLTAQLANIGEHSAQAAVDWCGVSDRWQYELLADLFRPVCYATGKCEFMAEFDRSCNIRDRVQAYHERGISSERWGEGHYPLGTGQLNIEPIRPAEWLLDPGAAR